MLQGRNRIRGTAGEARSVGRKAPPTKIRRTMCGIEAKFFPLTFFGNGRYDLVEIDNRSVKLIEITSTCPPTVRTGMRKSVN